MDDPSQACRAQLHQVPGAQRASVPGAPGSACSLMIHAGIPWPFVFCCGEIQADLFKLLSPEEDKLLSAGVCPSDTVLKILPVFVEAALCSASWCYWNAQTV